MNGNDAGYNLFYCEIIIMHSVYYAAIINGCSCIFIILIKIFIILNLIFYFIFCNIILLKVRY